MLVSYNAADSYIHFPNFQILESKSLYKLQEVIDSSQLPYFLGGSCTCSRDGGCLRTNKGPWNDHNIMKLVCNTEGTFVRQITRASNEQHNLDSFQLQSLKERCSGSSTVESGSDFNDYSSPTRQQSSNYPHLTPIYEEVRAPDANGYYNCDDSALSTQNVIENDQLHLIRVHSFQINDTENVVYRTNSEGALVSNLLSVIKEKLAKINFLYVPQALASFIERLVGFVFSLRFEFWNT
ncbi:unnamed protein product [Lathyrus sativus]|nr:unnamed protein product [Lathyrus sativus]